MPCGNRGCNIEPFVLNTKSPEDMASPSNYQDDQERQLSFTWLSLNYIHNCHMAQHCPCVTKAHQQPKRCGLGEEPGWGWREASAGRGVERRQVTLVIFLTRSLLKRALRANTYLPATTKPDVVTIGGGLGIPQLMLENIGWEKLENIRTRRDHKDDIR